MPSRVGSKKTDVLKIIGEFVENNLSMLGIALPIINKYQKPKTVFDATNIITECIKSYDEELARRTRSRLFSEALSAVLGVSSKSSGIDRVDGKIETYDNCNAAMVSGYIEKVRFTFNYAQFDLGKVVGELVGLIEIYKKDDSNSKVRGWLSKNYNYFIVTVIQVCIVDAFLSQNNNDFSSTLNCFVYLMSLEMLTISDAYNSDDLVGFIVKKYSSKTGSMAKPLVRKYYEIAIEEAEKLWAGGDARTHGKMAKYLCDKYNKYIEREFVEKLDKQFPERKKSEKQENEFHTEYVNKKRYYKLSEKELRKKLRPAAEKYDKYYNPRGECGYNE